MAAPLLRTPTAADIDGLVTCWRSAFGDSETLCRAILSVDGLLSHAVAGELDGCVCSAMYAFDGLDFGGVRASYLYALGTLPSCRGQGLGGAVLEELCSRCFARGAELVFLCPADASLAGWYQSRFGMLPLCEGAEQVWENLAFCPAPCRSLTTVEYLSLRRSPVGVTLQLLEVQSLLLNETGGGFFVIELDGSSALACAEKTGDSVLVRELCCAPEHRPAALQAIAAKFGTHRVTVRTGAPLLYLSAHPGGASVPPVKEFSFNLD